MTGFVVVNSYDNQWTSAIVLVFVCKRWIIVNCSSPVVAIGAYIECWDALSLSDRVCPVRRCHWSHWILLEEIADCIWAVPHWCLLRCDGETVTDFFPFLLLIYHNSLCLEPKENVILLTVWGLLPKLALRKYISPLSSDALQADNRNISCMLKVGYLPEELVSKS